jgi:hypothetical protein
VDAGGGERVILGEAGVERGGAEGVGLDFERLTEPLIGWGTGEEAAEEGLQIEWGAADEEGHFAARLDVGGGGGGPLEIVGDAGGLPGVEDVEEVVGDLGPVFESGLGGADIHATIEGHGVDGDDLGAQAAGELEGESGFADGGGAGEIEGGLEGVFRGKLGRGGHGWRC